MKRLSIIFLLFLFAIKIFPQDEYKIKQSVLDFFNLADSNVIKVNKHVKFNGEPSDNQIKHMTKVYYKAVAEDPVGFRIVMHVKHQSDIILPGVKMRIMREAMSKKYGENFIKIIGVPYYLKIKINNVDQQKFHSHVDPRLEARQVNYRCKIEDVIKGQNRFSPGDSITISSLGHWLSNSSQEFKVGSEYFVAIRTWDIYDPFHPEYTLNFFDNNNIGLYQIENGIIRTPKDFFGVKERMNWKKFRRYFKNKFMRVE